MMGGGGGGQQWVGRGGGNWEVRMGYRLGKGGRGRMGDGTLQILYLIGANPTQASHDKRVGSIAYTIKV